MTVRHDEIREVLTMHGFKARDGRSPMDLTDAEVEAYAARMCKTMGEFGRQMRAAVIPAIRQVTVTMQRVAADPAVAAAIQREAASVQREGSR